MTAIKATPQDKVILDFSTGTCSKNRIKQALRKCEIVNMEQRDKTKEYVLYENIIKVGMYTIVLYFPFDSSPAWRKLRDYGDFNISIHDDPERADEVDIKRDPRFKGQYWVNKNFFGQLRIKHLIDIIAHCHRLNKLRAFL